MLIFILMIVVVCVAAHKLFSPSQQAQRTGYDPHISSPEYVRKAMPFMEFYHVLPQKWKLIVTPQYIGVRLHNSASNDYFGTTVMSCLNSCQSQPQFEDVFIKDFLERNKAVLGGDQGVQLFLDLKLEMKLHDDDDDQPVIYMPLLCSESFLQQEKYAKTIQKIYLATYHEQVEFIHLETY